MEMEHWYAIEAALWAMTFMFTAMGFELFSIGYSVWRPSLTEQFIAQLPEIIQKLDVKSKETI